MCGARANFNGSKKLKNVPIRFMLAQQNSPILNGLPKTPNFAGRKKMSDQSSAGVEQSGKSGGDAAAGAGASGRSYSSAGTSQWGASGAEADTHSHSGAGAYAGAGASGGDVTDQTSIGSINVSS